MKSGRLSERYIVRECALRARSGVIAIANQLFICLFFGISLSQFPSLALCFGARCAVRPIKDECTRVRSHYTQRIAEMTCAHTVFVLIGPNHFIYC